MGTGLPPIITEAGGDPEAMHQDTDMDMGWDFITDILQAGPLVPGLLIGNQIVNLTIHVLKIFTGIEYPEL